MLLQFPLPSNLPTSKALRNKGSVLLPFSVDCLPCLSQKVKDRVVKQKGMCKNEVAIDSVFKPAHRLFRGAVRIDEKHFVWCIIRHSPLAPSVPLFFLFVSCH